MIIVIDGGRNCSIVIIPFRSADFTVTVNITEVLQEFKEDLFLGHQTLLHFWMETGVEGLFDVIDVNVATEIFIEGQEGFVDNSLTSFI